MHRSICEKATTTVSTAITTTVPTIVTTTVPTTTTTAKSTTVTTKPTTVTTMEPNTLATSIPTTITTSIPTTITTSTVPSTVTTPENQFIHKLTDDLFWISTQQDWYSAKFQCESYDGRLANMYTIYNSAEHFNNISVREFWYSGPERIETPFYAIRIYPENQKFEGFQLDKEKTLPALCEVVKNIGYPLFSTKEFDWDGAIQYCKNHSSQLACHSSNLVQFLDKIYRELSVITFDGPVHFWYGGPCIHGSKDSYSVEVRIEKDYIIVKKIQSKENKRALCEKFVPTTTTTTTTVTTPGNQLIHKLTDELFWISVYEDWYSAKYRCKSTVGHLACVDKVYDALPLIWPLKIENFWYNGKDCHPERRETPNAFLIFHGQDGKISENVSNKKEHFPALCEGIKNKGDPFFSINELNWNDAVQYCKTNDGQLSCHGSNIAQFLHHLYKELLPIASEKGTVLFWYGGPCIQSKEDPPYSIEVVLGDQIVVNRIESKENKRVLCEKVESTTTVTTTPVTTTTTTTTATTTPFTTSTFVPICCQEITSREIKWETQCSSEIILKSCPDGAKGNAKWSCDLTKGKWTPSTPDLADCTSDFIQELNSTVDRSDVPDALDKLTKEPPKYGGDILGLGKILSEVVDNVEKFLDSMDNPLSKKELAHNITNKVATLGDNILSDKTIWKDLNEIKRTKAATELLHDSEKTAFQYAYNLDAKETQNLEKNSFTMQVMKEEKGAFTEGLVLPRPVPNSPERPHDTSTFALPPDFDQSLTSSGNQHVTVVYFLYKDLSDILVVNNDEITDNVNVSSKQVNSPVISVSLNDETTKVKLEKSATFVVHHYDQNFESPVCSYWNTTSLNWDSDGCKLVRTNKLFSECACDHLTNFAVLMDVHNALETLTDEDLQYLETITLIGCIISIVFLSATIVITTVYRTLWGMRNSVHRNLCICLLIAEVLFVSFISRTEAKVFCSVIAGLLHYFFTAAFCWMFLEAVVIYLLLYKVFSPKKSYAKRFYAFGYGIPLLIVGISAGSRPTGYGTDLACWLSAENGFRWSFMGPVAFILGINTVALVYALHIAIKTNKKMNSKTGPPVSRTWILGALTLVPLLGSTWIIGFFLLRNQSALVYTFTILNSLQGTAVFIVQCLLNQSCRKCLLKSLGKYTSLVSVGSQTSSARRSTSNSDTRRQSSHLNSKRKTSSTPLQANFQVPTAPDGAQIKTQNLKNGQSPAFLRSLSSQSRSFDLCMTGQMDSSEVCYSTSVDDKTAHSPVVILKNTRRNEACF